MDDFQIEWLLRDGFKESVFAKGRVIARLALKLKIDYVNDFDQLYDCIDAFLPLADLTAEELAYAAEYVIKICTYEANVDKGFLEYTDEGYKLTEAGIRRKAELAGY